MMKEIGKTIKFQIINKKPQRDVEVKNVEPKGQISNTLQSDLKRLIRFIYKFSS